MHRCRELDVNGNQAWYKGTQASMVCELGPLHTLAFLATTACDSAQVGAMATPAGDPVTSPADPRIHRLQLEV